MMERLSERDFIVSRSIPAGRRICIKGRRVAETFLLGKVKGKAKAGGDDRKTGRSGFPRYIHDGELACYVMASSRRASN